MSPYKSEPTILPKSLQIVNAPMILGAPQRVVALGTNRSTPQVAICLDQAMLWHGKKRDDQSDYDGGKRIKKGEKGGKGLRHFSMKVCEKVQKKGVTSYNEVADELVSEFSVSQRCKSPTDQAYDQKNIRRRVYDALNVLMAMNIISKEKKEIRWLGLPTNSAQDCINMEQEKQRRLERIRVKTQQIHELILQQIAFKNLVQRNAKLESTHGIPGSNTAVHLPFIIVSTDKQTVVDCSISSDKTEYMFQFDNTFEISDDIEVLKRMGMAFSLEKGECTEENFIRAKKMIPKALEHYVEEIFAAKNDGSLLAGSNEMENMDFTDDDRDQRSVDEYHVNHISEFNDLTDSEQADSAEGQLSRHSSLTSLSEGGSNLGQNSSDEEDSNVMEGPVND